MRPRQAPQGGEKFEIGAPAPHERMEHPAPAQPGSPMRDDNYVVAPGRRFAPYRGHAQRHSYSPGLRRPRPVVSAALEKPLAEEQATRRTAERDWLPSGYRTERNKQRTFDILSNRSHAPGMDGKAQRGVSRVTAFRLPLRTGRAVQAEEAPRGLPIRKLVEETCHRFLTDKSWSIGK